MKSLKFLNKLCILTLLIACIAVIPVSATVTLSGVKFMADVAPGTTVTYPMTLSLSGTDNNTDYEFTVLGFGNDGDGSYIGIDPTIDTSPNSARPYITLDKPEVSIAPGSSETVTATVNVQTNINGGLYALINIHPKPVESTGTGATFVTAMNVPIMLTIMGTPLTETGEIKGITADGYSITTEFTNTGNHHYYNAKNTLTGMDSSGKQAFQITTEPLITAIVPGESVNFKQLVDTTTAPGEYAVTATVYGLNETVLATSSATITLTSGTPVVQSAPTEPETPTPLPTATSPVGIEIGIISLIGAAALIVVRRR